MEWATYLQQSTSANYYKTSIGNYTSISYQTCFGNDLQKVWSVEVIDVTLSQDPWAHAIDVTMNGVLIARLQVDIGSIV